LDQVLAFAPPQAGLLADVTLGGGGHAAALLEKFPKAELFGCDRDPDAVAAAGVRLAPFASRILLKQLEFSQLHTHLLAGSVDYLLADLGVSSPQLDLAGRGFSFSQDGPLDMRMDQLGGGSTAAQLLNTAGEGELREILFRLGEERFAGRIVKAILAARAAEPLETTGQLARLVASAVPARYHRKGHHPATRTFQALRIAVNDELGQLERLLEQALPLLKSRGRMVVISFHSLEDRPVKSAFVSWEKPCQCPSKLPLCVCGKLPLGKRITRKPIKAGSDEAGRNPRSRGAKLRVFEKI
jgi:16S rRNA (cytosine1402-N4)-methyltransferase